MDDKPFWVNPEFRICHEFAGLSERRYQYFWCDGFIPGQYLVGDARPRITDKARISHGQPQAEWDFTLLLPRPFASREGIDRGRCCRRAASLAGWHSMRVAGAS